MFRQRVCVPGQAKGSQMQRNPDASGSGQPWKRDRRRETFARRAGDGMMRCPALLGVSAWCTKRLARPGESGQASRHIVRGRSKIGRWRCLHPPVGHGLTEGTQSWNLATRQKEAGCRECPRNVSWRGSGGERRPDEMATHHERDGSGRASKVAKIPCEGMAAGSLAHDGLQNPGRIIGRNNKGRAPSNYVRNKPVLKPNNRVSGPHKLAKPG
jgi:hypothetical protein